MKPRITYTLIYTQLHVFTCVNHELRNAAMQNKNLLLNIFFSSANLLPLPMGAKCASSLFFFSSNDISLIFYNT